MLKNDLTEDELKEIQRMFTKLLSEKTKKLANEVWDDMGWSNDEMKILSKEQLRISNQEM